MNASERIRVFVCHACPVTRAGLVAMLARHDCFDCTSDDSSAAPHGREPMPVVFVADLDRALELTAAMRTSSGLQMGLQTSLRVLVVDDSDRECDIRAAISAGVLGYLLVDDAPEQLAAGIHAIRLGRRTLSPKVAARLAENMAAEALTQREQAVLRLVVEGLCNKSIANRLGITPGTVKSHLRSAFGKLGAASRTQAIAIAHRRGLLQAHAASTVDSLRAVPSTRRSQLDEFVPMSTPAVASVAGG